MSRVTDLRWRRIVAGGIATHVLSMVVLVVVIVGYSFFGASGAGGRPNEMALQQFGTTSGALLFPALTILLTVLAAMWVVRRVDPETATSHGVGVGVVVGLLGLAFGALDGTMLIRFITSVVAGVVGAKLQPMFSVGSPQS